MKFKNEHEITTPQILYEIVADFGEDGTATIFSSRTEHTASEVLEKLMNGQRYSQCDLTEEDMEYLQGLSLQMTIEVPVGNLNVATFGGTEQVMIELYSNEVDK